VSICLAGAARWRPAVPLLVAGLLVGCPNGPDDDTGDDPEPGVWFIERQGLSGSIMSVWGTDSEDIWIAGTVGTGDGPIAMHWDGTEWTDLEVPTTEDLWWVTGPDADHVWFSGDHGTVFRYDRNAETFTEITTTTNATLFGIWGPDGGPMYAVGGEIGVSDSAVVIRIVGDVATEVDDLPAGIDSDEAIFKPWGTAANNVWVIGTMGSVMNFNGTTWSRQVLPGSPRLITLNGNAAGDMIVVGGAATGVIFERIASEGVWSDVTPAGAPPLNGVFLTDEDQASVAGFQSKAMAREGSVWTTLPPPTILNDWHAVWIDERGHTYVAGGDLIGLTDGTLLRFDPDALPPSSE
jgi:hypothetical protein